MKLSDIFRVLGDDTRLRILNLLTIKELCVCQIDASLKLNQPNVSKHLNKLRYSGIIKCRKKSIWCFYSLSKDFKDKYMVLFSLLYNEFNSQQQYIEDNYRLDLILQNTDCCQDLSENDIFITE